MLMKMVSDKPGDLSERRVFSVTCSEKKKPDASNRSRTYLQISAPDALSMSLRRPMASKAIKLVHAEKLLVYLEDGDVDI